jgi:flagellar basal-body rod protein FlgB
MGIERFLFSDPVSGLLARTLDVHSHRADVVAGNLANVDTPGYKARDVDFRAALQDAVAATDDPATMKRTHPSHMGRPDLSPEFETEDRKVDENIRVDGNTVDQDKEMQKLAESQLLYNAAIVALSRKNNMIRTALNGKT